MILRVYLEHYGKNGFGLRHSIQDLQGNTVAEGDNADSGANLTLRYGTKTFRFGKMPVRIEKSDFPFPLPRASKSKKTLGFEATNYGEPAIRMYMEPMTCGKTWIFKQNIGIRVYQKDGNVYLCAKVGFPKETSHYYCLKSVQGETLAVIERHSFTDDTYRASIYLKNPELLELAILVCANEVMNVTYDAHNDLSDPSAGHYISIADAEKALYDKDFIPAVKALDRIYD
ncbi:MAG: hypothetical protein SPI15_04100 [Candidatus Faecousia sp.]|nr:hypothetical protein [Clostridiales bacterium]MDY6180014.1 hypothetical protein [Candidatus Faecousia sp.]